jgi:biopolymer transport protein ExbD
VEVTTFKAKGGIREEIMNMQKKVSGLQQTGALGPKDQTTVLIKPDTTSTYDDLVNILDEMSINDVRVYAIIDITAVDQQFIHETEAANGEK